MKKLLVALVLAFPVFCFSQVVTKENAKGKAKELFDKADNSFAFGKLFLADSLLHDAVKEKDNFIDAWMLLGQINLEYLKNFEEAKKGYEKVKLLQANYLSDVDFQLARCNMNLGNYSQAKTLLTSFLHQEKLVATERIQAEKYLTDCDFSTEAVSHPVDFKPVNLGGNVNSSADESMPSLTADGKYLYFTRHFGQGAFQDEDIFMSLHTSAGFAPAISVGDMINTERFIEGAQNISPSGKYLFFTSSDRPDGLGRADIYISRKVGDIWERPNNMGSPINTPGYETQPCISADGKQLFFSAIRATGKGGCDIWVCHLNADGTWSQAENLGDSINTPFDEMRPYIHPDGNTLYFSSNGLPGLGNYDIYVSHKNANGKWGKPENLGYPINTAGDELGIYVTADGTHAFFASEQKDSKGQMDIYTFDMPAHLRPGYTTYVKGNVFDNESREPISANVQVYDLETGKLFSTFSTDKVNGTFLSTLPAGKNYAVEVMRDGYLFFSKNISLKAVKEGTPFEIDIALSKIRVGEKVVLNNIFFDSEKFELKKESASELSIVMKMLEKNPSMKIEIGGHTDNTGSEEKNKALSESRAKSVYEYLVSKGVTAEKLSYKGYAASKPVAANNTPEGKSKNRRTEFIVLAI